MNEEIAIKICEQMTSDVNDLCICCRKNEKDRTCIGCRELAIETILKENSRLKDKNKKALELLQILHYNFPDYDDMHKKIEDIEEILKEN